MIVVPENFRMTQNFHLVLLLHAHQPCGNFGQVFEKSYEQCYLPFLELLERHPAIHVGLHYSGPLLEWMEENRPDYFALIRQLARRGQVEMVGGGFYEPILIAIPPEDQQEQIARLANYIEHHFGQRPAGAWLAERVWEPQLPSTLAAAGVQYTLVDDIHFLAAGFEAEELFGPYIAEDRGQTVKLFPGQKILRYLIPFGTTADLTKYFRESASVHPGGAAIMGDDMEKFGVWPETHKHCYEDKWLENFFGALEENADWLKTATPSEYLAVRPPLGRADLPTASYTEMMEWALPTRVRQRYHAVAKEFHSRPEVLNFLRGGCWRGFFRKYPEANLLHKKMLRALARVAGVPARPHDAKSSEELAKARELVLRGQCNDAYWHGIFGGLYAPHLRTELWRNLVRAETLAERQTPGGLTARVEETDYDGDGQKELVFTAPEYQVLVKPSDGGTLAAVDFRGAGATLINSITRRPEAYHARLREAAGRSVTGHAVTIHGEHTRVKEPGLDRFLRYDRWARHAFRVLVFDPERGQTEYERVDLGEDASLAGGCFRTRFCNARELELELPPRLSGPGAMVQGPKLTMVKRFSFRAAPQGFEIGCELRIRAEEKPARPVAVGIESVLNFLAPGEPDRFFEGPRGRENLRFSGTLPGPVLRMEDGWQRIRVALHAPNAEEFWVAPIETVSESEGGFERVYQGSQILAVWKPELAEQAPWRARLVWQVEGL